MTHIAESALTRSGIGAVSCSISRSHSPEGWIHACRPWSLAPDIRHVLDLTSWTLCATSLGSGDKVAKISAPGAVARPRRI